MTTPTFSYTQVRAAIAVAAAATGRDVVAAALGDPGSTAPFATVTLGGAVKLLGSAFSPARDRDRPGEAGPDPKSQDATTMAALVLGMTVHYDTYRDKINELVDVVNAAHGSGVSKLPTA